MTRQTPKSLSDELRERAAKALISYAIFRWESAVTLAVTLLLTVFFRDPFAGLLTFWRWWFWLVLGIVAEALLIYTSIRDPQVQEKVVRGIFREKFNPNEIATPEYRRRIDKALEYREQMEVLLQRTRDGALHEHLQATVNDLSDWISSTFSLARRLDDYRTSGVLHQDRQSIPESIQKLQQRLSQESNAEVRAQIEQTIAHQQAQLQQLVRLDNTMDRAELQLDDALSAMGTIYAQMQLVGAKDIDSSRAQRLRDDIADEVDSMHDILLAMDEVRQSSAGGTGQ
jgi:hypothetical protein